MKIGAQMYTIRDYCRNAEEIEASLRKLKAMGFDLVQLSGLGPCSVDHLAGWLNELGITACGTHSPWDSLSNPSELKKLIDEHKKMNCPDIGLGMKPDIYPDSSEGYARFIKKVNEICKMVNGEGMTFSYHNHDLEFQKFDGVPALDRLAEECPNLCFTLDVFWVQAGGMNPSVYLDKLKGRIQIAHFKDFRIVRRNRQFAEIGEGNFDWSDIIPRCEKNGVPCAVIEQDGDFLTDPFDSLAMSRKYLVEKGYWS